MTYSYFALVFFIFFDIFCYLSVNVSLLYFFVVIGSTFVLDFKSTKVQGCPPERRLSLLYAVHELFRRASKDLEKDFDYAAWKDAVRAVVPWAYRKQNETDQMKINKSVKPSTVCLSWVELGGVWLGRYVDGRIAKYDCVQQFTIYVPHDIYGHHCDTPSPC